MNESPASREADGRVQVACNLQTDYSPIAIGEDRLQARQVVVLHFLQFAY